MKKLFALLFLFVLLIPSFAFGDSPQNIRVATLSGTTGLAMVKLMEKPSIGGVPVTFDVYNNPNLVMAKLIAGEVDIAGLPTNMAAILYNKGVGIQLGAIVGWGVMYVVSSDPAIKKWSDLKGKEVYVASKGAISDILFQYLVTKNGLNPGVDLKIQYIASAVEIAQLAASGKITTAAMPEPWVTETLEKNPNLKIALNYQKEWQRIEKKGLTYPQTCIVVSKKFATEHKEILNKFLKELQSSIGWIKRYPSEGGALAEKYIQIPAIDIVKGLSRCNLKYTDAVKVRTETDQFIQKLLEFYPDAVGGKAPDETFYYQP